MDLLPLSRPGRVGLLLEGAGIVGFAIFLVVLQQDWFRDIPPIAGWGLPVLAALVGCALVIVGIARRGDRSLLGWIALVPGAFFLLLQIAELTGLME